MEEMFSEFNFNEIPSEVITEVNGLKLPEDYIEFMKKHNGGEGNIGNNSYGCFFKLEELEELNNEYGAQEEWPGYIIIGSDMGDNLWAYNPEKTITGKDTLTPVFTAALFTIDRTWKQANCPSTEAWIKKMW